MKCTASLFAYGDDVFGENVHHRGLFVWGGLISKVKVTYPINVPYTFSSDPQLAIGLG